MGTGSAAERDPLPQHVARFLSGHVPAGERVCVALSGGLDSVVLLDLCWAAAARCGIGVGALHVDHGISPRSGEWAEFCGELCRRRGISLAVERAELDARIPGLEMRARAVRRAAYARCGAGFVALAHHRDDQAETFLFRALRGGGAGSLGCMRSAARLRAGVTVTLLRPLLDCPRSELRAYAERRGLEWREDESNAADQHSRNFIRNCVFPVLEGRFPGGRESLAAQAAATREASVLLGEIAQLDHARATDGSGWAREHFRRVGERRTRNWLHHLSVCAGAAQSRRQIAEAARQICLPQAQARRLALPLGAKKLAGHGDLLYIVAPARRCGQFPVEFRFHETSHYEDQCGMLTFSRDDEQGISLRNLRECRIELRRRAGGEKMREDEGRPRRRLGELLRMGGVLPWERDAIPLIYADGSLAAIPNVCVGESHRAGGEEGYFPRWLSRITVPAQSMQIAQQ